MFMATPTCKTVPKRAHTRRSAAASVCGGQPSTITEKLAAPSVRFSSRARRIVFALCCVWRRIQKRKKTTPHDVKNFALDVLRHRVAITYEAEAQGKKSEDVIDRILAGVLVP